MSEFLLLGARAPAAGELSPGRAARDLAAVTAWHWWLRRWGLRRAFGLAGDSPAGLRAGLVIAASGEAGARRLAAGWSRVSGYRVTVLPLDDAAGQAGGGP